MDCNARSSAASQKKPIIADSDLVELLWHNGSVVVQPQAHQPAAPPPSDRPSSSGLTGEETAAWFPDTLDDALEKDLYTQLWYSAIADASPQPGDAIPGPRSQPPLGMAHPARPPVGSGVESSWAGDICSAFCGSNQVFSGVPAGDRAEDTALPSEPAPCGTSTRDGAGIGTSSSGGSGSNFGGSRLRSDSGHAHKKKGRCRDDTDSRSEAVECEATEVTKSSRRHGSKRRTRTAEVHNLSERRRRDRINEKMRALQELIPHCNKTDKASILDEAIEYMKSLKMQVQIMWMTSGMAAMIFPGAHQFMPPMALGMNSPCMPSTQRVPYMNHPLPNHKPLNSSPTMNPMNPLNVANQMQNIHLREVSNPFLYPDGEQTAAPEVPRSHGYGTQTAQTAQPNRIPELPGPHGYGTQTAQTAQFSRIPKVPASTVLPTSTVGQPPTYDGV